MINKRHNPLGCVFFMGIKKGSELPLKRRERDSNPRYSKEYNGFRDRPIRPLWHLSFRGLTKLVCLPPQWRRNRDSNPRNPREFNGFQDRRIRPLCHFSERCKGTTNKILSKVIFPYFLYTHNPIIINILSHIFQ